MIFPAYRINHHNHYHPHFCCNIFLVELSRAISTKLSIGCIINGTDPSPAAVGSHFDNTMGSPTLLATANLDARTMPLITPPGIATLARP